jgi:hypothetical protein
MRSPFPSLSADELRDLITGAGFRDVRIFLGIGPVRYPSETPPPSSRPSRTLGCASSTTPDT